MLTLRSKYVKVVGLLEDARDAIRVRNWKVNKMRKALRLIADQKTPHANATVSRMAKLAEEALD